MAAAPSGADGLLSGMTERPLCKCHGEPMYWQKDPRRRTDGYWICAVKNRARSSIYGAAYRAAHREEAHVYKARYYKENREAIISHMVAYNATGIGYVKRRRRDLAAQRGRVEEQLIQLQEEAITLGFES